jgi:CHASE2 domain-containing sensor protein
MPRNLPLHIHQSIRKSLSKLYQAIVTRVSINRDHLLRGILVGVIISILVTSASLLGHLKPQENLITDFLQSAIEKKTENVALLFITDNEYKAGFQGTSPLSRKRLAEIVDVLIKLKSRVIALDIDLSDATSDDQYLVAAFNRAVSSGVSIVTIGNLKNDDIKSHAAEKISGETSPYEDENLRFTQDGSIQFDDFDPGDPWRDIALNAGIVFRLDRDGVFRRAEALYLASSPAVPIPSLPVAMAAAYLGFNNERLSYALSNRTGGIIVLNPADGRHHGVIIRLAGDGRITPNFIGNYQNFDHSANIAGLLEDYSPGKPPGMTVYKDKIVLIGGVYDVKDFYMTPVGRMSGMEIIANITQNIVSENLITHVNFFKAFIMEILLGAIASFMFVLTTRVRATLICFLTIIPAVAAASIISFSSLYYWFDFVPTIAGVVIHGWAKKVDIHRAT